ncbi:15497_t:CDS:2, partial [Racocetra persica]
SNLYMSDNTVQPMPFSRLVPNQTLHHPHALNQSTNRHKDNYNSYNEQHSQNDEGSSCTAKAAVESKNNRKSLHRRTGRTKKLTTSKASDSKTKDSFFFPNSYFYKTSPFLYNSY